MNDGMSGGGGGTAAPAAPAQGGQQGGQQQTYSPPAPQQQRARVGEFSAFSAGVQPALSQHPVYGADGIPGQQIGLQDAQLVDRQHDPGYDPFSADQDAHSLALATSDDPLAAPAEGQEADDSVMAQVVTADEIRQRLEEYESWKRGDDLPDPLMDKFVVAQVDGQRYRVPVREVIKGYQRNENYSNQLRALNELKRNLEQREAGLQKLLTDMDQGQSFLDAVVFLDKFKGFSEAAIIYGTQLDAERRMTPEQRQVHQHLRAQRAELQRLALENRALRGAQQSLQQQPQPQQGPSSEQVQAIYMQQLKHLAPAVAQRIGFVNTPVSQLEFEKHFNARLPNIAGQDLTSEFVEDVMLAAMESVESHLRRSGYAPPAPPQPPAAGPGQQGQQGQPNSQPRQPAGQRDGGQWARQQAALAAQRRGELPPVSQVPGPGPNGAQQKPQRARIGDFNAGIRGRL